MEISAFKKVQRHLNGQQTCNTFHSLLAFSPETWPRLHSSCSPPCRSLDFLNEAERYQQRKRKLEIFMTIKERKSEDGQ
jgi:hypothetical protein